MSNSVFFHRHRKRKQIFSLILQKIIGHHISKHRKLKTYKILFVVALALASMAFSCDPTETSSSESKEDAFDESKIQFADRELFDLAADASRMITSGSSWYDAGLYEFSENGKWLNPKKNVVRDSLYRIVVYGDTLTGVIFTYADDGSLAQYAVGKEKPHKIELNARDMEKGYDYIAIDDEGNWIGRIDLKRKESDRNRDQIRFVSYFADNDPFDPEVRREILDQYKDFPENKTSGIYYTAASSNVYASTYPYRVNSKISLDLLDVYATNDNRAKGITLVVDNQNGLTYFATTHLKRNDAGRWQISWVDYLNMFNFEKTPADFN